MRVLPTVLSLFILLLFIFPGTIAAATSEQAQRHFNRGMAAVEMATSPDGYELAIDEFRKAATLAPDWADVHYNLGMVQEKAGRYREAVDSLRRYLQLAPNAPDAAEVRILADKLEFKADQVLSEEDVLAIYETLSDLGQWRVRGISNANLFRREFWVSSVRKREDGSLLFTYPSGYCGSQGKIDQEARLMGNKVEFATFYCACEESTDPEMCASVRNYSLEVVSRNKVKAHMKCTYTKKFGGGSDEALLEFVRN